MSLRDLHQKRPYQHGLAGTHVDVKGHAMTGNGYITIADAADLLSVSTKTVRRYMDAGKLTPYRLGERLVRLDPAEVQSLLRPIGVSA